MAQETPRARLHPLLGALLAIATFGLVMLLLGGFRPELPEVPPGRLSASAQSLVDDLSDHSPGWRWARDSGSIQPVRAVCRQHLLNVVSVDAVLADEAGTYVLFTVYGPAAKRAHAGAGIETTFNGVQLGSRSGETIVYSGNQIVHSGNRATGILALDPLPQPAGDLSVQLYTGLTSDGCQLSFYIERSALLAGARTIPLTGGFALGDGQVTLESLTVSPVQTVLRATWSRATPPTASGTGEWQPILLQSRAYYGDAPAKWGTVLLGPDHKEAARGLRMAQTRAPAPLPGTQTPNETSYSLVFDRLRPEMASVTIAIGGAIRIAEPTELPLQPGTYTAADGRTLEVESVDLEGSTLTVVISESFDDRGLPTSEWQLLYREQETSGPLIPSRVQERVNLNGSLSSRTRTLTWKIARGRTPIGLVLPHYWTQVEAGELTIRLK